MARSSFASNVACGRSLRRRAASANEGASRIFLLCAGDANETATSGDRKFFFFYKTSGGDSSDVVADAEEERAWAGPSAVQLCARLTRARERGAGGSVWVGARVACP